MNTGDTAWVLMSTVLVFAMTTNIVVNSHYAAISDSFPFIGVAVWADGP